MMALDPGAYGHPYTGITELNTDALEQVLSHLSRVTTVTLSTPLAPGVGPEEGYVESVKARVYKRGDGDRFYPLLYDESWPDSIRYGTICTSSTSQIGFVGSDAHIPRLDIVLLARDHDLDLLGDIAQPAQHDLVTIHEPEDGILDTDVFAELTDQRLHAAQVVAGHSWEQVVHGLELESAVDEIQPRGAVNVHGGAQLLLGEGLGGAEVGGRHAPVGKRDLDVERHGDDVGDEDKGHAEGPGGEREPEEAVAEKVPVAGHEEHFGGAGPGGCSLVGGARGDQVQPREEVEVEARDSHDGVVGVFLESDGDLGGAVPDEVEVVVAGADGLEEHGGVGEEGDVLDIRVVNLRYVISWGSYTGVRRVLTGWFGTKWWTLWLLFHHPMDNPQQKSAIKIPTRVSKM
ncbi:hypothetical protein V500_05015 [Pseudogymnoascus sp. VKM F-4518 (FW-2643)]|nr:hypothetical protein V500_05015 [Pseudogymnoascus sp. VKM F-4518 (FW-2643)]